MDNTHSISTEILTFIVRVLGLVMLLVGLYVGIKVILEAWHLYEQPQRIERFATAIEQGSHIDSLLASLASPAANPAPQETDIDQQDITPKTVSPEHAKPDIRMTYFLAWGIVILLLMVIGGLASSAIKTGGQLALYDLQVKRFAQQLIDEARKDHS
ncbi:MAG: hypothetical protein RQ783_02385 [Gammaproteobacteria bacterium]|nr:hypothetical protein [Gammaproteobacteria bacterium]